MCFQFPFLSIQKAILKNTEKLVELCVTKLNQDWFPLLDLLSLVFNPMSRYVQLFGLSSNCQFIFAVFLF